MKLHHLRITCRDAIKTKQKFLDLYSFREYGHLIQDDKKFVVVKHRDINIVIREDKCIAADTIDDIAFCVGESLAGICSRVRKYGGSVLKEPYTETCSSFSVMCKPCFNCATNHESCLHRIEKAIVKSSVGNVEHTLIRSKGFVGDFLTGFIRHEHWNSDYDDVRSFDIIDHIAFAVPCGETLKHMEWYKHCLHLHRFKCNRLEKESGLVIKAKHGRGLRLFSLIQHPCSEVGVSEEMELGNERVKFVFGESLTEEGTDQIQRFLKNHTMEGVQHIAFRSNSIIYDTQEWFMNGVSFLSPPKEYYQMIDNTLANLENDEKAKSVQELGILIDVERTKESQGSNDGYLYQVFTNPVLPTQTFFFELIQRDNSFGFGTGNVSALWNAIDMRLNGV